MINIYNQENNSILKSEDNVLSNKTFWVDLINMSAEEEALVENFFQIDVPSQKEAQKIEVSKKLFVKDNALYITVLFHELALGKYFNCSITFILYQDKLITVRYRVCKSLSHLTSQILNHQFDGDSVQDIFLGLISNMVEKIAETLEHIRHKTDIFNEQLFFRSTTPKQQIDHQIILDNIGYNGNLIAKVEESSLSLNRAIHYLLNLNHPNINNFKKSELTMILNDIDSLTVYSNSLLNELTFSLDATLGMIAIEQNNNIKFFTVLSIMFLPPTLIASIYGMNFRFMPELELKYGYIVALISMLLSACVTYKLFKIKKWI